MKTPLLLVLLTALTASAAHAESLRADLTKYNAKMSDAIMTKNFPLMSKLMFEGSTKDFKYTEDGRVMDMKTMVKNMGAGLGQMGKMTDVHCKLLTVKEHGNIGEVTAEYVIAAMMPGRDKKSHLMASSSIAKNTYVKSASGWKMRTMVSKTTKMTMDGKPFDPSAMMKH